MDYLAVFHDDIEIEHYIPCKYCCRTRADDIDIAGAAQLLYRSAELILVYLFKGLAPNAGS